MEGIRDGFIGDDCFVCGASTKPGRGATPTTYDGTKKSGANALATTGTRRPRSGESGSTSTSRIGAVGAAAITSAARQAGVGRVNRKYATGIIGAPARASARVRSCFTMTTSLRLGKPP